MESTELICFESFDMLYSAVREKEKERESERKRIDNMVRMKFLKIHKYMKKRGGHEIIKFNNKKKRMPLNFKSDMLIMKNNSEKKQRNTDKKRRYLQIKKYFISVFSSSHMRTFIRVSALFLILYC